MQCIALYFYHRTYILPMANLHFEFATKTDTGLVRSQNEDAIALSPNLGLAVLADGMGGYNAGEVASSMAVTVVKALVEYGLDEMHSPSPDMFASDGKQIQQLIVESIQRANSAILAAAQNEPQYLGMGTTLVTALFHEERVSIAHVGDSRAYRLRQGELVQLTRDHSLLQEHIDAGLVAPELARFSQYKNLITRAIGVGEKVEVEVRDYSIVPDDTYLLCSDGLYDMLSAQEMWSILLSHPNKLEYACEALVERANYNGGLDNTSVILVKVHQYPIHKPKELLNRLLSWIG